MPLRRADRLFDIIRILRAAAERPVTAAAIAGELEVTVRTVYRDVATLQARRIPLEGVQEDKTEANFRNGVLTVSLPKTEQASQNVKRIAINTN